MDLNEELDKINQALIDLDIDYIKGVTGDTDNETALISLHKARYEVEDIEDKLRLESRDWLEQRGYHRMYGLPFPPKGQLPEPYYVK